MNDDGRNTPIWTQVRTSLWIPPGLWRWHFENALLHMQTLASHVTPDKRDR